MSTVGEILARKGGDVACVRSDARVLDATRVMNDRRIGSVVVIDPQGGVAGILTERDLLTRVLAVERDPRTASVADVMTREVIYAGTATSVDELRVAMREHRIRHVPVRDDAGRLCGLVSIGDLNAHYTQSLVATVETLEAYITRG